MQIQCCLTHLHVYMGMPADLCHACAAILAIIRHKLLRAALQHRSDVELYSFRIWDCRSDKAQNQRALLQTVQTRQGCEESHTCAARGLGEG